MAFAEAVRPGTEVAEREQDGCGRICWDFNKVAKKPIKDAHRASVVHGELKMQKKKLDENEETHEPLVYEATERKLEIVVDPGDEVSEKEMTNAAWTRAHKRTGKDRIDHLAFVFMKQNDAQLHLHEMWLRELEVWYVDGKGNHRIDEDYAPKPNRPAWAKGK